MNNKNFTYELIDSGDQKRLEKFGDIIVSRPAPQAFWPKDLPDSWNKADAVCNRVDKKNTWTEDSNFPNPWHLKFKNVTIELRPSSQHQVGIFPEQFDNWNWMIDKIEKADRPLNILNLFAYTGVATLAASAAAKDVSVCHVDGAKSAINWAKKNAELSGLSENPIRWICDDVTKFVNREVKRGRKYDGIILDPPAFGRGPGGEWKLERDLPELLHSLSQLLSDKPLFVILSCHVTDWIPADLMAHLEEYFNFGVEKEALELFLPAPEGVTYPMSICARMAA